MAIEQFEKLVNLYHENKLSHAYLLVTNNIDYCFRDLKLAIKQIDCNEEYKENCTKCNICNLIDQNYLPSLIVIESDGKNIKKEQILELKRKFSTKPIYTKENIYVIKNAEALNSSSANTMLKFLEEPEDNIIGFFITNNVNNVINTIKSRCEIINIFYDVHELNIDSIDNDINKSYLDVAKNYLKKIEVEKNLRIMYNKSELLNFYTEREDIKKIFQILVIILAIFLAIFLILGIILLILSIRISIKIQQITDNIEDASSSLKTLLSTLNQLASPAVVAKIVIKYIRNYINNKKQRRFDDGE